MPLSRVSDCLGSVPNKSDTQQYNILQLIYCNMPQDLVLHECRHHAFQTHTFSGSRPDLQPRLCFNSFFYPPNSLDASYLAAGSLCYVSLRDRIINVWPNVPCVRMQVDRD